jgi:hypothetical protein
MKMNYTKPLTVIIQAEVIKRLFPSNCFITNLVFCLYWTQNLIPAFSDLTLYKV